jgi:hypothetical protein
MGTVMVGIAMVGIAMDGIGMDGIGTVVIATVMIVTDFAERFQVCEGPANPWRPLRYFPSR